MVCFIITEIHRKYVEIIERNSVIQFIGYIRIYLKTVEVSGGGLKGVIDKGRIEGILEQVKNDTYYPNIEDKVTYLFFSLNKYHCFKDGNKRIALSACIQFLNFNRYIYMLSRFIPGAFK